MSGPGWSVASWLMVAVGVIAILILGVGLRWRSRFLRQIRSDTELQSKDRLELKLSVDDKFARLAGGAAILVGFLLTILQFLQTRETSNQQIFTERVDKAFKLVARTDTAARVGGVYALASVADADPAFSPYIYDALLALVRSWSPHSSPQEICDEKGAHWRSVRTPAEIQAAMWSIEKGRRSGLIGKFELRCVNLSLADLENAHLDGVSLAQSDLSGARLRKATLVEADLYAVNFYLAELYGANLSKANLPDANLTKANLGPAGSMGKVRLDGATLTNAMLYSAKLCDASLTGANLRGARLDGVKAYNADLHGAVLTETSFFNARLSGANFEGVSVEPSHIRPNFTCAILAKQKVSENEYCQGDLTEFQKTKAVPEAKIPTEVLEKVTLCRTWLDSGVVDRDCSATPPKCSWEEGS